MKRLYFFLSFFLLLTTFASAQKEPRLIVLYPNDIQASEDVREELKVYESKMEVTEELKAKFVNSSLPEHWQTNRRHMLEFMKGQDFFSLMTKATSDQLTYSFQEQHEVMLNFPLKEVSPADRNNYRILADRYKVDWVINYTSVELSNVSGKNVIQAHLQVYNKVSNVVWVDKDYTGEVIEGCDANGWECALSDLIGQTTAEVYDLIEKKRHYWSAYAY